MELNLLLQSSTLEVGRSMFSRRLAMRTVSSLFLLALCSQCLWAGLSWHEFDVADTLPLKIEMSGTEVEIVQRDVEGAAFKEDHQKIAISRSGSAKKEVWLNSSYGMGAVAIEGPLLFIRYGVGRGTFAREEHVRIYRAGQVDDLEEMADVKVSSYRQLPGSKTDDPVLLEYTIHVDEDKDGATIKFIPPSLAGNTLSEKSLRLLLNNTAPSR